MSIETVTNTVIYDAQTLKIADQMVGCIFVNAVEYLGGQRDEFSASLSVDTPLHELVDRKLVEGFSDITVDTNKDIMRLVTIEERFMAGPATTEVRVYEAAKLGSRRIIGELVSMHNSQGELVPSQQLYYSPGSFLEKVRKEKLQQLQKTNAVSAIDRA